MYLWFLPGTVYTTQGFFFPKINGCTWVTSQSFLSSSPENVLEQKKAVASGLCHDCKIAKAWTSGTEMEKLLTDFSSHAFSYMAWWKPPKSFCQAAHCFSSEENASQFFQEQRPALHPHGKRESRGCACPTVQVHPTPTPTPTPWLPQLAPFYTGAGPCRCEARPW